MTEHEIEFNYDGCDMWAKNGGYIMGPNEIMGYIGREAFFNAVRDHRSFKVTMLVEVEGIDE